MVLPGKSGRSRNAADAGHTRDAAHNVMSESEDQRVVAVCAAAAAFHSGFAAQRQIYIKSSSINRDAWILMCLARDGGGEFQHRQAFSESARFVQRGDLRRCQSAMDYFDFIDLTIPKSGRLLRVMADTDFRIVGRNCTGGRRRHIEHAINVEIFCCAVVDRGHMMPCAVEDRNRSIKLDVAQTGRAKFRATICLQSPCGIALGDYRRVIAA